MGGQLPRLPAFERNNDSSGILLIDLLYASGRRCCFGSPVRDRRYDMTLRVEDPEVQTELRNLAHCFRSDTLTLPFSKECTHTPGCADVAVLGGTDEAGAEPYRELEELPHGLGCSARVWQAGSGEVWTLSRQLTVATRQRLNRCPDGAQTVTADRYTPGPRDGERRGLCLSGQSPRANRRTARSDPVGATEWWCSVHQRREARSFERASSPPSLLDTAIQPIRLSPLMSRSIRETPPNSSRPNRGTSHAAFPRRR